MDIVKINCTDKVGQDGDWFKGTDDELRMSLEETFAPEDIDDLLDDYEEIDLDALANLDRAEWERVLAQWTLAMRNHWTLTADDLKIQAEVLRRDNER